jgi:CYTH domain-containing protein/predicted ATPase
MKQKITRIAITGGPCAGKTTIMVHLQERLENLGYQVYIVPEAATILINGGADPRNMDATQMMHFQLSVVRLQLALEESFLEQARSQSKNVVLLYDRGIFDGAAYTTPEQWGYILQQNGLYPTARDSRYDAILHLVTAAIGAPHAYTRANNKARRETLEEAIEADLRTQKAWCGHPHLRIINNSTEFQNKIHRALTSIMTFLGEPTPIESERKFIISFSSEELGKSGIPFNKSEIVQHYLANSLETGELRIRRRGNNNLWVHTMTTKIPIPGNAAAREEIEEPIEGNEYWSLINNNPEALHIQKNRTCVVHNDTYFEIDEFPQMPGFHIMEVETEDLEGVIQPPPGIQILAEVTGNKEYGNYRLAEKLHKKVA